MKINLKSIAKWEKRKNVYNLVEASVIGDESISKASMDSLVRLGETIMPFLNDYVHDEFKQYEIDMRIQASTALLKIDKQYPIDPDIKKLAESIIQFTDASKDEGERQKHFISYLREQSEKDKQEVPLVLTVLRRRPEDKIRSDDKIQNLDAAVEFLGQSKIPLKENERVHSWEFSAGYIFLEKNCLHLSCAWLPKSRLYPLGCLLGGILTHIFSPFIAKKECKSYEERDIVKVVCAHTGDEKDTTFHLYAKNPSEKIDVLVFRQRDDTRSECNSTAFEIVKGLLVAE